MHTGRKITDGSMRFFFCTLLAVILAACSYLGAKQPQTRTASVPVAAQPVREQAQAAQSTEKTKESLMQKREEALAMLQSVINTEHVQQSVLNEALAAKLALAGRMTAEAEAEAILAHMGFGEAVVMLSEDGATAIVPWQTAMDERSRMQIIDAVASQTAISPECVKIMPIKNE